MGCGKRMRAPGRQTPYDGSRFTQSWKDSGKALQVDQHWLNGLSLPLQKRSPVDCRTTLSTLPESPLTSCGSDVSMTPNSWSGLDSPTSDPQLVQTCHNSLSTKCITFNKLAHLQVFLNVQSQSQQSKYNLSYWCHASACRCTASCIGIREIKIHTQQYLKYLPSVYQLLLLCFPNRAKYVCVTGRTPRFQTNRHRQSWWT